MANPQRVDGDAALRGVSAGGGGSERSMEPGGVDWDGFWVVTGDTGTESFLSGIDRAGEPWFTVAAADVSAVSGEDGAGAGVGRGVRGGGAADGGMDGHA